MTKSLYVLEMIACFYRDTEDMFRVYFTFRENYKFDLTESIE